MILAAIPFVLESKIDAIVQAYADENINAKVEFDDVSLSLLSSFPNAKVTIDNLTITNNEPFKDETFTTAKSIGLKMPIKELFKSQSDEPIAITNVAIDEALMTLKENKTGTTNWDIFKTDINEETSASSTKSSGFKINIEDYFGKEQDKVKELKTEDKIYATVVNIGIDAKRKRLISLSNGHIWRELSDVRLKLKVKDSIYIERGILGSFFLGKTNENSRIKVRRVD